MSKAKPGIEDAKARIELLGATANAEKIDITLGGIDAGDEDGAQHVRRCRALGRALTAAMYELIEHGRLVLRGSGSPPRQLSLFVEAISESGPALTNEQRDTVEAVVASVTGEKTSAEKARELAEAWLEIPPAAKVDEALRMSGRIISLYEIEKWSRKERLAAIAWGEAGAEIDQDTSEWDRHQDRQPEHVQKLYLEDFDFTGEGHRLAALDRIAGGTLLTECSPELWDELSPWATTLLRKLRGEDVEVPDCPALFVPNAEILQTIKAKCHERHMWRAGIFEEDDWMPKGWLAWEVLCFSGEIGERFDDDGEALGMGAAEPELRKPVGELIEAAAGIGRGETWAELWDSVGEHVQLIDDSLVVDPAPPLDGHQTVGEADEFGDFEAPAEDPEASLFDDEIPGAEDP